jgi:hypothetical protein
MTAEPRPTTADVLDYASPGRTRAARPPRPPVVPIVLLGLVLFPLVVVLAYPIAWLLPFGWRTIAEIEVPTSRTRPDGFPADVYVWGDGPGGGPSTRMTRGNIRYPYDAGGPWLWMNVDLREMTFRPTTRDRGEGPFEVPLTHETLRAELVKGGFDTGSGEVSGLTASIMFEVQKLAAGQLPTFDAAGRSKRPAAYRISWMEGTRLRYGLWFPWYMPWCIPAWLLSWVLLAKWLLRRHRRRLAAFHERSLS